MSKKSLSLAILWGFLLLEGILLGAFSPYSLRDVFLNLSNFVLGKDFVWVTLLHAFVWIVALIFTLFYFLKASSAIPSPTPEDAIDQKIRAQLERLTFLE